MKESYILWLHTEMFTWEKKISKLDPEIDKLIFDLVEERLGYIYNLIASNTK